MCLQKAVNKSWFVRSELDYVTAYLRLAYRRSANKHNHPGRPFGNFIVSCCIVVTLQPCYLFLAGPGPVIYWIAFAKQNASRKPKSHKFRVRQELFRDVVRGVSSRAGGEDKEAGVSFWTAFITFLCRNMHFYKACENVAMDLGTLYSEWHVAVWQFLIYEMYRENISTGSDIQSNLYISNLHYAIILIINNSIHIDLNNMYYLYNMTVLPNTYTTWNDLPACTYINCMY